MMASSGQRDGGAQLKKLPSIDAQADKLSNNSDDSGVEDCKETRDDNDYERNKQMLEKQMSCDVIFRIGKGGEQLGAHKDKLAARSDVFQQMFSGPDAAKSEFVVENITPDVFWELLRHIYCDTQKLDVLHVVEMLYAAEIYNVLKLRTECLDYLKTCIGISNACYLLVEARKYQFRQVEERILKFICRNAEDIFETPGMNLLSREMLNQIMTMPSLDVKESVKREAIDNWAKNRSEIQKANQSMENTDPLQDCLYVYRDDSASHRYILDSLTTNNIFEEPDDSPTSTPEIPGPNGVDFADGMSSISSNRSRSSVHTYSRLPSCNMWPDLAQVTRLQEVHGTNVNNAQKCDAISFTVDRNIYLYGFSIYGPKKEGEGQYQVDTVFTRKKRDIVLETIRIKGAGIILPVMFERPVKVDAGIPYRLEIYITGPDSHSGASGQSKIQQGQMLFTFNNVPKMKDNRSSVSQGQIPRLYFLPREAKAQNHSKSNSLLRRLTST